MTSIAEDEGDVSTVKAKPKVLPLSEGERSEIQQVSRVLFPKPEESLSTEPLTSRDHAERGQRALRDLRSRSTQSSVEDSFNPVATSTPFVRERSSSSLSELTTLPPSDEEESKRQEEDDYNRSFLEDFLPNLPPGVTSLASASARVGLELVSSVAAGGVSAGGALIQRAGDLLNTDNSNINLEQLTSFFLDTQEVGRNNDTELQDISLPFGPLTDCIRIPVQEVMAATTFPREIKVKELDTFDGTPSELEAFDGSIK